MTTNTNGILVNPMSDPKFEYWCEVEDAKFWDEFMMAMDLRRRLN